jgi:hypothetical protein
MLHHCFTYRPLFKLYAWVVLLQYIHVSHEMISYIMVLMEMSLTLVLIYIDLWKSFLKFGIKKSHEMISYILVGMVLLSV